MAWCDVVEPRTLRECRLALGQSQAGFAAMLGASPESYRTWDAGRRATPLKILARARALATHRDDHAPLPLSVLALLIGVHVKTETGSKYEPRAYFHGFNGAADFHPRKRTRSPFIKEMRSLLQWGRGLPSAETRRSIRTTAETTLLQWGRGLPSAETITSGPMAGS